MNRTQLVYTLVEVYKNTYNSNKNVQSALTTQVEGYLMALTKELFETKEETTQTT